MVGFRSVRGFARGIAGLVAAAPLFALLVAAFVARSPAGDTTVSAFPIGLLSLDPFVWTCIRNSVIFAGLVTATALVLGSTLGWTVARGRYWGRPLVRAAAGSLLAASPFLLALGQLGLWGAPHPWPWPFAATGRGGEGVTLESWKGLSLWALWVWSSVPSAVAIVMYVTAGSVQQLQPAWSDAARLAGLSPFRAWRSLMWPLVRPAAAKAAALVFPLALVDPGAPLVLGLRRTIAFQIAETAMRPAPFPRLAVWAAIAGLIALAGRLLVGWWGGPPILDPDEIKRPPWRDPVIPRRAGAIAALGGTILLMVWAAVGWLPAVGLFRLVSVGWSEAGPSPSAVAVLSRWLADPPIPQVVANSLILGLEAAVLIAACAWLARPAHRVGHRSTSWPHLARFVAVFPPLIQGVGILAIPWLLSLAAQTLRGLHGSDRMAALLGNLAVQLGPDWDPWILLVCAVSLTGFSRFLLVWDPPSERGKAHRSPCFDAAILAGASRTRARAIATRHQRGRAFGQLLLTVVFAATNLTPALLFTPFSDGRTTAPEILALAVGSDDARSVAAALAIGVLATQVAALAIAGITSAWPGDWEPDRARRG
jgi:ABC-type Fe3+ transport system permease subunit